MLAPTGDNIGATPLLRCSPHSSRLKDAEHYATRWLVSGAADTKFENPIHDSGPLQTALTLYELPGGIVSENKQYRSTCEHYVSGGLISVRADATVWNTRAEFTYVKRSTMTLTSTSNVQERPMLSMTAFEVVGGADTHAADQYQVKNSEGVVVWTSPELAPGVDYQLVAGLIKVSRDYIIEGRQEGEVLGWSEWSVGVAISTAQAFVVDDEVVYFATWQEYTNASAAGVALNLGAVLRSNPVLQGDGEADWVSHQVRVVVRGGDLGVRAADTTAGELVVSKAVPADVEVITDLGRVTPVSVSRAQLLVGAELVRGEWADFRGFFQVVWSPKLKLFCALGYLGYNHKVAVSADGVGWTFHGQELNWSSICWSPDLEVFCVIAGVQVGLSADGINWAYYHQSAVIPGTGTARNSLIWITEKSKFYAIGKGHISTSATGQTFTDLATGWYPYSVCYSPSLDKFCVVGVDQTNGISNSRVGIGLSSDGNNYTFVHEIDALVDIAWSPQLNLFVAIRESSDSTNTILTSPDGENWTMRIAHSGNWRRIKWVENLNKFIVTSYGPDLIAMMSTDAVDWQVVDTGVTGHIWDDVCWTADGMGLAVSWASQKYTTAELRAPIKLDISNAGWTKSPSAAHIMPAIAVATGAAEVTFTADDYTPAAIEMASIITDDDPTNPQAVVIDTTRKDEAAPFRKIAVQVEPPVGTETRISEVAVNLKKQG